MPNLSLWKNLRISQRSKIAYQKAPSLSQLGNIRPQRRGPSDAGRDQQASQDQDTQTAIRRT